MWILIIETIRQTSRVSHFIGCVLLSDIDECSATGMCINGRCVNEMGKYRCECDDDFMPNLAGTGCIGNVTIDLTERHNKTHLRSGL